MKQLKANGIITSGNVSWTEKGAAHREAALAWLKFVHLDKALEIFSRYGFRPYHWPG